MPPGRRIRLDTGGLGGLRGCIQNLTLNGVVIGLNVGIIGS